MPFIFFYMIEKTDTQETSTDLLQNAAKMMHGETLTSSRSYKPNFTYFSFTQFQ